MVDIINGRDWALDPGFIQWDAIAKFVHALPRAQQQHLVKQQKYSHNDRQRLSIDEQQLYHRNE